MDASVLSKAIAEMGRKGGKIGGKRSLEMTSAAERKKRAKCRSPFMMCRRTHPGRTSEESANIQVCSGALRLGSAMQQRYDRGAVAPISRNRGEGYGYGSKNHRDNSQRRWRSRRQNRTEKLLFKSINRRRENEN